MQNFIRLLFLAALAAAPAMAQSTSPMKTKALSFNINGLNLSGLNGGTGGKLWMAGNRALVASVDAGYSSETREDVDSTRLDEESSTRTVQFDLGVEQHHDWAPGLSPYLTGGVSLAYVRYENKAGNIFSGPTRSEYWTLTPGIYAGFGLEYWVAPRISIAGQQVFSAAYGTGKQRYSSSTSSSGLDVRTVSLSLGTSSLILSVYL